MAKDASKKPQVNVEKMAKLIFFKKTSKKSIYNFGETLMTYQEAIDKAKEITK